MAVLFNGGSFNLGAGSTALANVSGATLTCWIRATGGTANGDLWGFSPGGAEANSADRAYIVVSNNTIILFGKATDGSGTQQQQSGANTFLPGELAFVAAVFNYTGNRMILYKNNTVLFDVAKTFGGVNTSNTSSNGAAIGADGDGSGARFTGFGEDFRCYARALGPNEIQTIYAAQGKDQIALADLRHRYLCNEQGSGIATSTSNLVDLGSLRRGVFQVTGTPPNFTGGLIATPRNPRPKLAMSV